jgi:glyceraldehyde-3-phosphate dehydrogenase (NADP+)
MRLDADASAEGRLGYVGRVPKGPVLAITPFNFPLNLVAHKVAPALAVGAPVVVKPAPRTPLSALLIAEIAGLVMERAGMPAGMLSVVNVENDRALKLVADPRLPVVSFTGSGPVGRAIQDAAPRKHVVLELGGNAAVVVCEDWTSEEDLAFAAQRIAAFSTYQAGQSCVGVQRVFAHESVYDEVRDRVVLATKALGTGDPDDPDTHVGPMIDEREARRVEQWVREAVDAGGTLLIGGERDGATYSPRRCWRAWPPTPRWPARRSSVRCSCWSGWRRSTRRSHGSTTPATACRPACSPATCAPRSGRSASSRSEG